MLVLALMVVFIGAQLILVVSVLVGRVYGNLCSARCKLGRKQASVYCAAVGVFLTVGLLVAPVTECVYRILTQVNPFAFILEDALRHVTGILLLALLGVMPFLVLAALAKPELVMTRAGISRRNATTWGIAGAGLAITGFSVYGYTTGMINTYGPTDGVSGASTASIGFALLPFYASFFGAVGFILGWLPGRFFVRRLT